MNGKRSRWILAVAVLALAASVRAAPDGAMLAASCSSCHGDDGVSAGPATPSLAGQPRDYFVAAMRRFRSGERSSTVMGFLAKGYSDRQIEAMAAYFASCKPAPQGGPVDAEKMQRGLKVYDQHCKYCHLDGRLWNQFHEYRAYDKACSRSCHVDYGSDTEDELPLIGGQWPAYLKSELEDFRSGGRPMSKRKAQHLKALSSQDLEAAAQFYAGQKELER